MRQSQFQGKLVGRQCRRLCARQLATTWPVSSLLTDGSLALVTTRIRLAAGRTPRASLCTGESQADDLRQSHVLNSADTHTTAGRPSAGTGPTTNTIPATAEIRLIAGTVNGVGICLNPNAGEMTTARFTSLRFWAAQAVTTPPAEMPATSTAHRGRRQYRSLRCRTTPIHAAVRTAEFGRRVCPPAHDAAAARSKRYSPGRRTAAPIRETAVDSSCNHGSVRWHVRPCSRES